MLLSGSIHEKFQERKTYKRKTIKGKIPSKQPKLLPKLLPKGKMQNKNKFKQPANTAKRSGGGVGGAFACLPTPAVATAGQSGVAVLLQTLFQPQASSVRVLFRCRLCAMHWVGALLQTDQPRLLTSFHWADRLRVFTRSAFVSGGRKQASASRNQK